jgi:uncharacterized protein (TIGR02145 family)
MTKNLDVDTYRNGDPIPLVTDDAEWAALTTGAYCYYDNDSTMYAATYGKLYNWYAVNDPRGLAPEGWHVPTEVEWNALTTCLGGEGEAGGAMKEIGTVHWFSPNTGATNFSGFTGLPGGFRDSEEGDFFSLGANCFWWSSSEDDAIEIFSFSRYLDYPSSMLSRGTIYKRNGYSVRCIRD